MVIIKSNYESVKIFAVKDIVVKRLSNESHCNEIFKITKSFLRIFFYSPITNFGIANENLLATFYFFF